MCKLVSVGGYKTKGTYRSCLSLHLLSCVLWSETVSFVKRNTCLQFARSPRELAALLPLLFISLFTFPLVSLMQGPRKHRLSTFQGFSPPVSRWDAQEAYSEIPCHSSQGFPLRLNSSSPILADHPTSHDTYQSQAN